MTTMLAARYLDSRVCTQEVSLPEIGDEEALIELMRAYLWSDITSSLDPPLAQAPLTLGHELRRIGVQRKVIQ